MSEYINNVTRRKETLKNVLRQLHEGQPVTAVQAEFGALAAEANAGEIAEVEQMLIDEGLPVEQIQSLCDVHVAVFRAGLDQQRPPETIPGHPIHTFRLENERAAQMLAEMERTLAEASSAAAAKLQTFAFQLEKLAEIDRHYARKENLLFPYLERSGFQGPAAVMWGVDDDIRRKLRRLEALAKSGPDQLAEIRYSFSDLAAAIREMVYKEERILFPAAIERLQETDWAAIRSQESELGYFFVVPGGEWQPLTPAALHAEAPASDPEPAVREAEGLLPLQTGALSLSQVDLVLRHLPVDVTFVDENDTVRYYSQTRERIFERTPAIIGRKVQNCHPPQSVHRVQQILDDFRTGRRDEAEFWINLGPKFVVIRYIALRDAQGRYCGTLEVTQDAAHLRQLTGERRLLDE